MTPAMLHRVYGVAIALVVMIGVVLWGMQYEQRVGERSLLTHQADSALHVQTAAAAIAHEAAAAADAKASKAALAAKLEQRKDSLVKLATDSAIRSATEERERARLLLVDSTATLFQLRAETLRLVAQSRADSAAFAAERTQRDSTISVLTASRDAERAAKDAQLLAYRAQLAATLTAQGEVALLRKTLPSTTGNVLRGLLAGAAGFGLGHLR